ncbi:SpaA isopeptide-forming pilin-related protein, partial [Enterococcus canintestini]|uniref:SpaA isopeptide-forming pilin-related protein n=1 Tax=Enterococcus canintestini TaxID=317010 RepID=UPI000BA23500
MKRWVSIVMLMSLLGNFCTPLVAVAEEIGTKETAITTEESTTTSKNSEQVQTTEETNKKETIPLIAFDQESKFKSKNETKGNYELNLLGSITSEEQGEVTATFETTKSFVLEKEAEKGNILNQKAEKIGEYKVETTAQRMKYILNFNKLVKGENRFRLILLGSINRGPDMSLDFYQEDKKIFQLDLPQITESSSENDTDKTSDSTTNSTTTPATESSKEETSTTESSTSKTEDTQATKNEIKPQVQSQREPESLDDLFNQYAPGDNFVKNIQLNFDSNPPTIQSAVDFRLDFTIPDTVRTQMIPGDYYEMDFPEGLAISNPSPTGTLKDDDGVVYGTYIFDASTQKLRITFTQADGQDFSPADSGYVTATVRLDQQKITTPGKTTIIYPSKTNIPPLTITVKPTIETSISKEGHTDTPNNPNKVIWEVDFNKNYAELNQPLITESFPSEVTFNQDETGSVSIYPLYLDLNGKVTGMGQTPVDSSLYTVAADGSVQFKNKIDSPYRIVYATTIKDSAKPADGGKVSIINNVTLTADDKSLDASASVDLNYKESLKKEETGYNAANQTYNWIIRYNYGQKELADDTVISDTYSSNMEVLPTSFKVNTVHFDSNGNPVQGAPLDPNDYTINTDTNPFTITFKNDVQVGTAINIEYQTKVKEIVTNTAAEPVKVTNNATTKNIPTTPTISKTPAQQIVIKNKPTIDVGAKSAFYSIDINKNGYEMDNAKFTDSMSYTDKGYTTVPLKVKNPTSGEGGGVIIQEISEGENNGKILTGAFHIVNSNGDELIPWIGNPDTADYTVTVNATEDGRGYNDFTVEFKNAYAKTSSQFKMSYYIIYNQFSEGNPSPGGSIDYKNTITANFQNNGTDYSSSSSTDFKTSTREVNQGMKSGSYNPVTKEITWTIVTNYNNMKISGFDFKDPITGNQVYLPDSLEITRGTITANGSFKATTDSNYSGNQKGQGYVQVTNPTPSDQSQGTLAIKLGTSGTRIPGWDVDNAPMVYRIQFKTSLKGQIVYDQSTYRNTATTLIDGEEEELSASVSIAFGGKSALKTASYDEKTGLIDWNLIINPNQSLLADVKVEDNPSSNQIIKEDFTLYTGKYSGSGSSTTVQPDQEVPKDQYEVKVITDPATGQQQFTVDMSGIKEIADPNNSGEYLTGVIEKPYVLVYQTEPSLTSKTETVTNSASISSEGKELPGKDTEKEISVTIQDSSGAAYGKKGKVVLQKTDGKGGIVAGAVLQLIRENTNTNVKDVLYQTTTDNQGKVTFGNLIATSPVYKYYVKEIEAPDGYTIPQDLLTGKEVEVNTNNDPAVISIKNEPIYIHFEKTDGAGKALAGGVFNLFEITGTPEEPNYRLVKILQPTLQGEDLSGLGDGHYRIQEMIAPDGYQINHTLIDFEVKKNEDNTRSVFIDNQKISSGELQLKDFQGSAVLQKTNEGGDNLAGAQFHVQRAELNSDDYSDYGVQNRYVTDASGRLLLENLSPGKYKVKESKAPDGYYLNGQEFDFAISPITAGNEAPTTIELNEGKPLINYKGTARFLKVDGHDYALDQTITPLAGAQFQLYDASGTTKIGSVVTSGSDGYFEFPNLEPGTTYAFKEVKAPDDYILNQQIARFTTPLTNNQDSSAITIDTEEGKRVVDFETPYKNYKEGVYFQKIDIHDQGLGNAKYQLLKQESNNQWQQVIDPKNGAESDGMYVSNPLDGVVAAFFLAPGKYKFVEQSAPAGYLLNTLEIPFEVADEVESNPGMVEIPISNQANVNYQGSAQLYKEAQGEDSFNKLEGATFDVFTDENSPQKVTSTPISSDKDGNVTVEGLAPGKYYFQEVSNGGNYLVNTQRIAFTIPDRAQGKPTVVTTNDQTALGDKMTLRNYLGSVELTKVDKDNNPLGDAEFTVYNQENIDVGKGVTDHVSGIATIGKLAPGKYTVKETKAPTGYLLNDTAFNFEIPESASGKPNSVKLEQSIVNYQGSVKLIKTDLNNQPLKGAKFQLLDDEDHPVGTSTSNEAGEVVFRNLAPGQYNFKEVEAPEGYILNTATIPVEVPKSAGNEPTEITVKDSFINYQGVAQLMKTDGEGNPLQGATFKVTDDQGKDIAGKVATSDQNGLVEVTGLAPGDYRFVETSAPNKGDKGKYIMTNEDLAFQVPVESKGKPDIIKITDSVKNYRGTIRIHKVGNPIDDDTKIISLSGAEFTLYTKSDFSDDNPLQVTSNEKGLVEFSDLEPGTYYVKETKAPNGYLLNTFPLTFVIPERVPTTMPMTDSQNHTNKIEDGTYVIDSGDFHNAHKEIQLKKADGENSGNLDLSDVRFALYFDDGTPNGTLIKEDLKPESDGMVNLSNLALEEGSYKLVETTTSSDYLISSQPIYFVVDGTQVNGMKLNLVNYQAAITGKKTSGDKKLAGAEYQIFRANDRSTPLTTTDKDGNSQTILKTDNEGEFYAKGLSADDYILKEVKAPTGYILDETTHKFTIHPQKDKPETLDLGNFENYQGTAKLIKKAMSGKLLAQATFDLQDAAGNIVQKELITDESGVLTASNLAPGDYQFVETKAPAGYILNTTPVKFNIADTATGSPETVVVTDNFINYQGEAQLIKHDVTGKALAGALFEVQDTTGKIIQSDLVSNRDGKVTASNLAPGDYQFVETKAPAGYILNTTPVEFSITDKEAGKPEMVVATDNFVNYQGEAQLIKKDANGKALADAIFELQDLDGETIQKDLKSDDEGKVIASNLAPGDYQFVETKAPAGYILNTTPVKFSVADKEAGKPETVVATDNFVNYQGKAQLIKKDANGKALADAIFELQDSAGKAIQKDLKSDDEGKVTASNLAPGDYQFVETKAPENYLLNTRIISFTIQNYAAGKPDTVITTDNFVNYQGEAQLIKKDGNGKALADAIFEVQDSDGETIQKDLKSDDEGKVTASNLAPGDYQFVETKAPAGYVLNTTP